MQIIIETEQDMLHLGAQVAKLCPAKFILFLQGDLGAGKTTFVRGFIKGAGFKNNVKSPTYTLVEPYQINQQKIYHFDLYRLEDPQELELIGIRDYFAEPAIYLIEWPERAIKQLPSCDMTCNILPRTVGREVHLKASSAVGQILLDQLANQYRDADQTL